MAGSKKKKVVKEKVVKEDKRIFQICSPSSYYSENPRWSFSSIDTELWAFSELHIGNCFWSDILPKLVSFERKTWSEILIAGKKQNHSIRISDLNKFAQQRLEERYIEAESIISLRLTGKQRLYGFISEGTFSIIWYDDQHGDNNHCVCRSKKKHT